MTDRRTPGGPGEQLRDRLFGRLAERPEGEPQIVGAVVVIAVILLLIPRGQGGPGLWLVVALVFGGAVIETVRVMRSGEPLKTSLRAAGRLLAGPLVFVTGAAIFVTVARPLVDAPIPQPIAIVGAVVAGLAAWFGVWRLFRVR